MSIYSKPVINLSVRSFVEFVLRSGDLESGFHGTSRFAEGIRYHQALQRSNIESCPPDTLYTPEVTVTWTIERDDLVIELAGRIDGVWEEGDNVTIEEIKTTDKELRDIHEDSNPVHWGQAKCYAFIYAEERALPKVNVRLTYFQVEDRDIKTFERSFTRAELKSFMDDLVERHREWARTLRDWAAMRDESIKQLEFPFTSYRRGQRELAVAAYRTILDGKKAFIQAPTGIGKTMAVLFPAVKSIGEGHTSKIFYLTAKTITRTIAENALEVMRRSGLRLKTITITAKDKTCFSPEKQCSPDECEFAKGYYDRLSEAIRNIYAGDSFTRPVIEEYARKHRVCPFEFSLDLSLWADAIVCDYNYVFDPRVYLKRYFAEESESFAGEKYSFLVDEAHNLVDRAREMFSAEFRKEPVMELKRMMGKDLPTRLRRLEGTVKRLGTALTRVGRKCTDGKYGNGVLFHVQKEQPDGLYASLQDFLKAAEKVLSKEDPWIFREQLLDLYFEAFGFMRTVEYYDERYVTYFEKRKKDVLVKLFCVDPSHLLKETLKRGNAALFFSATLTPLEYFMKILGADEDSLQMRLPSPFPKENLLVLTETAVSTTYRMRELTCDRVVESIAALTSAKTGNYLVYFPSYKYMNEVHARFAAAHPDTSVIIQKESMSELEREVFLGEFSRFGERTLVAFAVMGGIFGEGIDLVGERLSGVVIVGVGLPQICLERDIIRDYFKEAEGTGFEFAYSYPGMNKVLQAVGRLIRTETDRGAALLIDERFANTLYRRMFPPEWHPAPMVRDAASVKKAAINFWKQK